VAWTKKYVYKNGINFQNQLKALSFLAKEILARKLLIGTMTDWVHSLEESHCAYSEKLADIKDSNQAQPQREELCQTNITRLQKSIDDIEQKILLEGQVLESHEVPMIRT